MSPILPTPSHQEPIPVSPPLPSPPPFAIHPSPGSRPTSKLTKKDRVTSANETVCSAPRAVSITNPPALTIHRLLQPVPTSPPFVHTHIHIYRRSPCSCAAGCCYASSSCCRCASLPERQGCLLPSPHPLLLLQGIEQQHQLVLLPLRLHVFVWRRWR